MTTTVFKSGNSLCVRLPKGFELPIGRVIIERADGSIVIRSGENGYPEGFFDYFAQSADDTWKRPDQADTPDSVSW